MRVIDFPELGYYVNIIANSRTCIENHLYIFFIVDIAKCTNYIIYGIRITEGKYCYTNARAKTKETRMNACIMYAMLYCTEVILYFS